MQVQGKHKQRAHDPHMVDDLLSLSPKGLVSWDEGRSRSVRLVVDRVRNSKECVFGEERAKNSTFDSKI
jgi:hypothetical protein